MNSQGRGKGRQKAAVALARRDPDARRRLVLEVATRMFAERGYEKTSVNDVAAEAGVAVGTLYRNFPDKAALLEGVLSDFEGAFVEVMRDPRLHQGPMLARIEPMMQALFELAGTREHFFWALTTGAQALRGERTRPPGWQMQAAIADFVRAGIEAGEFLPVDVEKMAVLGFGVVEAAMQRCFGTEQGRDRAGWASLVARMLERAVAPAPGAPPR